MSNQLNKIKVASPCPANWKDMTGNDNVRYCNQCNLNVYNISSLTKKQAEKLIFEANGRICGKIFRRADGTILTKDCPNKITELKMKMSKYTKALIVAVLGIISYWPNTYAQDNKPSDGCTVKKPQIEECKVVEQSMGTMISGLVTDSSGAIISGAEITVTNENNIITKKVISDEQGRYKVLLLVGGAYTIKINAPGFETFEQPHINLGSKEELSLSIILKPAPGEEAIIGIIVTTDNNERLNEIINQQPQYKPQNHKLSAR